jgi:hypothetical protein
VQSRYHPFEFFFCSLLSGSLLPGYLACVDGIDSDRDSPTLLRKANQVR